MTREEAVTVLNMVEAHGSLVVQAKDMAIKALETMIKIDKAETVEQVVAILTTYLSEGIYEQENLL